MHRLLALLFALIIPLSTLARAADAPELPSREPAVVIPLLNQFQAKDDPERITQILGKEDEGKTITNKVDSYHDDFYKLQDGTEIRVRYWQTTVYSIFQQGPEIKGVRVLYYLNKKWKRP